MKAVVLEKYGPPEVLKLADVAKPEIKENEILIRVVSTSVTAADSRIRGARFPKGFGFLARLAFGITKPRVKILGSIFSGVVEEVGSKVGRFKVGDEVCGMMGIKMGAYAEYIKLSTFKSITTKPKSISHQDAVSMLFGGTAALAFIKDKLGVKSNEKVLINGASGAVGTNAVQLAKYFGAKVTAVTSAGNTKIVQQIGADEVIDYEKQDIADLDQKFDVVLDTVGNISPGVAKSLINEKGRAGLMAASLGETLSARGQIMTGVATEKSEDIKYLLSLMEKGKLKAVTDSTYDLYDIVVAHKRADSGKKVGNIVINI